MHFDIRWIEAVFGNPSVGRDYGTHIAVPTTGRAKLEEMADELVRTEGMVALYVPEGTEDVYQPGQKRGRIIGVVQLLPMPSDKTVEDYFYNDWDGTRRWPYGWPARLVSSPSIAECPTLREHVESLFKPGSFGGYVKRFQLGPFRLEPAMRNRLNRDFARLTPA
jgi:hypothetical protein